MGYMDEKAWLRGAYSVVTDDTSLPFTLDLVKKHIRVETGDTYDDDLISALIRAAIGYLEKNHGLVLRPKVILQTLDAFPPLYEPISLRCTPVRSIESVKYLADDLTTLTDFEGFVLKKDETPAKLYASQWPTTQQYPAQVQVRALVGYATNADIPNAILVGVCLMVAHWYDNRSDSVRQMPTQAEYILQPYLLPPKV